MLARMQRGLSQPLAYDYMSSEDLDDIYHMRGSTGKSYIVTIRKHSRSTCNCPDYCNRNRRFCKHIILILLKEHFLSVRQISDLDQNENAELSDMILENSLASPLFSGDAKECPICLQQLEQIEWVCEVCHKSMHMDCIMKWFRISERQGVEKSCPMCRHRVFTTN